MEAGKVVEIIGAVIDVKFPRESIPKIFDALKVKENNLTLEVQQQIGDGVVRTIAMGSTDGLKRGLDVNNTGEPINVPVGEKTLGRIMNVLGEPIDNAGDINAKTTLPIHRPAPTFSEQASDIVGAGLCIGRVVLALMSPALSIGSPKTFIILPRVFSPTGTFIGSPVLFTSRPRFRPSVEPIAIVRTTPSPICCWTSSVKLFSLTFKASKIFGIDSRGNFTSMTAPIISTTFPASIIIS
jgi:hypothetical protein